jgi:hypothetical protein
MQVGPLLGKVGLGLGRVCRDWMLQVVYLMSVPKVIFFVLIYYVLSIVF